MTPLDPLTLCVRLFSSKNKNNDDLSSSDSHAEYMKQLQELQDERQELFGFTQEEEYAWQNVKVHSSVLLEEVKKARQSSHVHATPHHPVDYRQEEAIECTSSSSSFPSKTSVISRKHNDSENDDDDDAVFTHLDQDNLSVNMVNVGHKPVTKRTARARTKVVFPPEVMAAFDLVSHPNDLVGPKGPIFATAKIAGIMAAK